MKKFRHYLLFIVLLAMLITMSACGGQETIVSNEDVLFSNLKSPTDEMTQEERDTLDAVTRIISTATIDRTEDRLKLENTTDLTLDIDFTVVGYDENDTMTEQRLLSVDSFAPGDKVALTVYFSSNPNIERADIGALYSWGESFFTTDYIPCEVRHEIDVQLTAAGELPLRVIIEDYNGISTFILHDVQLETNLGSSGVYNLKLTMEKESGEQQRYESVNYRILSEDGSVCDSGTVGMHGLKKGEMFYAYIDYVELLSGVYTLELYSE